MHNTVLHLSINNAWGIQRGQRIYSNRACLTSIDEVHIASEWVIAFKSESTRLTAFSAWTLEKVSYTVNSPLQQIEDWEVHALTFAESRGLSASTFVCCAITVCNLCAYWDLPYWSGIYSTFHGPHLNFLQGHENKKKDYMGRDQKFPVKSCSLPANWC